MMDSIAPLSARPAQDNVATRLVDRIMDYIPKVSRDLDELMSLVRVDKNFAKCVRVLLDSGTPLTCADVDGLATNPAGDRVLTYHLSDPLKVLLATVRTENIDTINVPVG